MTLATVAEAVLLVRCWTMATWGAASSTSTRRDLLTHEDKLTYMDSMRRGRGHLEADAAGRRQCVDLGDLQGEGPLTAS